MIGETILEGPCDCLCNLGLPLAVCLQLQQINPLWTAKSSVSSFSVSLHWPNGNFSPSRRQNLKRKRRKRKLKKHLNANSSKKVAVQTETPSVPIQSQGTMSPINAHHTGKAIKAEEIAISQANTSHSKARTDINLAECPEINGVHGELFKVTKKPSEENWTPVVPRIRTFNKSLKSIISVR